MAGGAANTAGGIVNTAGGAMNQVGGKQIRGDEGESVRKGKCERGQEGGGERLPERKERPTLGRMYGLYRLQGLLAFVLPLACLASYYAAYGATGDSSDVDMVLAMALTMLIGQTAAWIASVIKARRIGVLGLGRPTAACLVAYCACASFVVACLAFGTRLFHVRALDRAAVLRLTAPVMVVLLLAAVASALASEPTADGARESPPPVRGQPGPPSRQRKGGGPAVSGLRRFVYRHQGAMALGVVAAITLMPGGVCKKGWMLFLGLLFLSPIVLFGLLLVRIVTRSRMKRSNDVARAMPAPTAVFLTVVYASAILYGLSMYENDGAEDHPAILHSVGVPTSVSFFFVSVSLIAGGLTLLAAAVSLAFGKPAQAFTHGE